MYNSKDYEKAIIQFMKAHPEGATVADVVVGTGLNAEWVEYTLRQLFNDYSAYLEINDRKELVYIFDFDSRIKTLVQNLTEFGEKVMTLLWKGFVFGFKAWIVLMLFTYLLFNIVVLMLSMVFITRNGSFLGDVFRYFRKTFLEAGKLLGKKGKKEKGVIHKIFSYVFGESKTKKDKLHLEKTVLQQIRANKGALLVSDLVQLTGWNIRDAQTYAARLLADYQGEVSISEEGVILYHFPELIKNENIPSPQPKVWQKLHPALKMNDNPAEINRAITFVNGFNMLMAFLSPLLIRFAFYKSRIEFSDLALFFISVIPFVFSFLFFLIPMVRMPLVYLKNNRIEQLNLEYQVLQAIFERLPGRIYPEEVASKLSAKSAEVTSKTYRKLVDKKALELEADVRNDENGLLYYTFEGLNNEQKYLPSNSLD